MIRRAIPRLKQAASIICKEGNPTSFTQITPLRATPVSFSPALPSYGGRSLSSKVPAGRPMTPSPSASKDKAQEAIDKAEQLHAELNEVCVGILVKKYVLQRVTDAKSFKLIMYLCFYCHFLHQI